MAYTVIELFAFTIIVGVLLQLSILIYADLPLLHLITYHQSSN